MAAVRPAGPEPMMMTLRALVLMEFRSRSGAGGVPAAEEQRSDQAQDSADDEVAEVHGLRRRDDEVEQRLQAPGDADQGQRQRGQSEEGGEQPEHDAAGDVDR